MICAPFIDLYFYSSGLSARSLVVKSPILSFLKRTRAMSPIELLFREIPQLLESRRTPTGAGPGVVIDYVNGPSKGWQIIVASSITIAAAFVMVATRMLVRLFVTHNPSWDDCNS